MNATPDLDQRLDEALEESFPASDPPAVHAIDPEVATAEPRPAATGAGAADDKPPVSPAEPKI